MPQDITTRVLRNTDLGHGNFLLEFEATPSMTAMTPAQFFMIGIPGSETLLRRPFSVCGLPGTFEDAPADAVQVLYKVVGTGTGSARLARAPGAIIDVLGPLGNGFEAPSERGRRPVFVAGGIGSAPFPALASRLRRTGRPTADVLRRAHAGRSAAAGLVRRSHTERLIVTTEDGSAGTPGTRHRTARRVARIEARPSRSTCTPADRNRC